MSQYTMTSAPDYIPAKMLREIQNERFMETFRYVYANVQWYRDLLEEHNVSPDSIKSIADISKLPFVKKTDLRDTYPFGMFAAPRNEIVRYHASSGTTGKPIVMGYTRGDLEVWNSSVARGLAACGINDSDVLQNAYGYGLFTGGLGLHGGGEKLGCSVVPISGGNTERQLMLMRDFGATVVSCTPSYFLHLIDHAKKIGFDWKEAKLRAGFFGAEPWTEEMRRSIESETGIKAYDIYGLTEISGPGVGCECACQAGVHIFEDNFYPEIVDTETLEPLPDGEIGELVFTTLCKRGTPLIRYRTRDITSIVVEQCACGRTIRRISRISHRSDDMMIIRGVNVFPGQIEASLLAVDPTLIHYQIVLSKNATGLDVIETRVELSAEKFAELADNVAAVDAFKRAIGEKMQRTIGINVKITFAEPNSLPRSEGKLNRVVDNRNK